MKGEVRQGISALLVAALLAALPASARAGSVQTRKGFWWGFGLGFGSAQVGCDQCLPGDREGSFSGAFRLGGSIGDRLLIGWEVSGWLKNDKGRLQVNEDLMRTLGNSSISVRFYPRAAFGTFVEGGIGVSYAGLPPRNQPVCPTAPILVALDCIGSQDAGAHANGFGVTGGVGHDFRIRRNMSIAPELRFALGRPGDLSSEGQTAATGWKQDIVALEIGLTFH